MVFPFRQLLYSPPGSCLCLLSSCGWRVASCCILGTVLPSTIAMSSSLDRSSPPAPPCFLQSSFRNLSLPFTVGKMFHGGKLSVSGLEGWLPCGLWEPRSPFPAPHPDLSLADFPEGRRAVQADSSACQLHSIPQACLSPLRAFNYH